MASPAHRSPQQVRAWRSEAAPFSAIRRLGSAGFSLVELMMVVLIISLLALMAVPAFQRLKMKTRTSIIANDLRVFAAAFEVYAQEKGTWPPEAAPGVIPTGMEVYLRNTAWTRTTPIGGKYNWENNQLHYGVRYRAAIAISAAPGAPLPLDVAQLYALDRAIDDGNLFSGIFRIGARLDPLYVIQQ